MIRRHRRVLPDRLQALPVLVLFPHSRCNCRCVCTLWLDPKRPMTPRHARTGR
jgi:hypothetical protein